MEEFHVHFRLLDVSGTGFIDAEQMKSLLNSLAVSKCQFDLIDTLKTSSKPICEDEFVSFCASVFSF